MPKQLRLNRNGVVATAPKNNFPQLTIQSVNSQSHGLVRLYQLITTGSPNILIRRGEGIGDVLMTTPILRHLKKQFPACRITYATNLTYLDGALPAVLENNPDVDSVVSWDAYKKEHFDAILNLHCPCIVHEIPGAEPISRQDLFARHIGIPHLDNPNPVLNLTRDEVQWAKEYRWQYIKARDTDKVILINPFASTEYRSFPLQEIKRTCGMLLQTKNIKVVILTHEDSDFSRSESWQQYCHHIARNIPVRKLGALSMQSDLLICPDSAALHIAGALDIPTLAIFGPTDPRARVNHYPTVVALWPSYNMQCYCWYESHKCTTQSCWRRIKAQDIYDYSIGIMNGTVKNNYYVPRIAGAQPQEGIVGELV
jgi:heptosyltransferase-2